MIDLLDKAVEVIRQMPAADQDTIASAMLSMARLYEGSSTVDPAD